MTVPLTSMAEFIGKTMVQSKTAIKARLRYNGWKVREGIPNMRNLPDDKGQVASWVFCSSTRQDIEGQSSMWQTEVFATKWDITLAIDAKNNLDPSDVTLDPIIEAATKVLESLTDDIDGVSLDGSVNWSDQFNIRYGIATVGGDRDVLTAVVSLTAHHPLGPCRDPPGV